MVYITGDTHIPEDIQKLSVKHFPQQRGLTKDDYVIICGDFGGVWQDDNEERYWLKWLKEKPFTTLFADGNHENFERLNALPTESFCGGTVHRVDDGIYHLMRGEVYTIGQKTFFVFGGGESHDKEFRKEGKTWWKEEMPSAEEYEKAKARFSAHQFHFDYVITHSAPASVQERIAPQYNQNELTAFLEEMKRTLTYKRWFFGHYHQDKTVDEKHIAVFDEMIQL